MKKNKQVFKKNESRKDNDPGAFLLRHISTGLTYLFKKTRISPNQITIFNFLFFAPLVFYFFIKGEYFYNIIALVLIFASVILDFCDGALARKKFASSKQGCFLDVSLDKVFQMVVLISITIGIVHNKTPQWYLVGFLVLVGQMMAEFLGYKYEKDFAFDPYQGSKDFLEKFNLLKKPSLIDYLFKNIVVPYKLFFIFLFTLRYLLILGVVFNHLEISLLIFGITINLRWVLMYLVYLQFLGRLDGKTQKSNLKTVELLQEIYNKK